MSTELIPILALVVMFIAATVWPVNMGALGFVAAFVVGTLAVGMSTDDIIGGFPGELFLTLVGVTYLFAIAQNNGTVDLMVRGAVRLVRGRVALIPWVMFGITGVLTAVGALGPAAVAIIAPIALGFAARYKIKALLMGMMVIHGAQAGGFSPISIYGVTVNTITADAGLVDSPLALFLGSLLFNAAIGVLLFVFLGGRSLIGRHVDDHHPEVPDADGSGAPGCGPNETSGASGGGAPLAPEGAGATATKSRVPTAAVVAPKPDTPARDIRADRHPGGTGRTGAVLPRSGSGRRFHLDDGRGGSGPAVPDGAEGGDRPDQLVDGVADRRGADLRRGPAGGRDRRLRR